MRMRFVWGLIAAVLVSIATWHDANQIIVKRQSDRKWVDAIDARIAIERMTFDESTNQWVLDKKGMPIPAQSPEMMRLGEIHFEPARTVPWISVKGTNGMFELRPRNPSEEGNVDLDNVEWLISREPIVTRTTNGWIIRFK